MHNEIKAWVENYRIDRANWEVAPKGAKPKKSKTVSHNALVQELPKRLASSLLEPDRYVIKGSDGSANWAEVSWVVIRDPGIAPSTQEGYYVVYLLSSDGSQLFLSINQGCTALKEELRNNKRAIAELQKRAAVMRQRLGAFEHPRATSRIELGTKPSHSLGPFYEAGHAVGIAYDCADLPTEDELIADFKSIVSAYKKLTLEGGWHAIEDIQSVANADGFSDLTVLEKKRYALHRVTERNRGASQKVKERLPDICMGCHSDMKGTYGDVLGAKLLEVHHLIPLHTLAEGTWAKYKLEDFAVLCPNCHRAIHRLGAEKLNELKDIVRTKGH